jgi:hypothetical protein
MSYFQVSRSGQTQIQRHWLGPAIALQYIFCFRFFMLVETARAIILTILLMTRSWCSVIIHSALEKNFRGCFLEFEDYWAA